MADESGEKPETEGAGGGVAAGEAPAGAESAAADDAAGSASPKPSADKGASDAAPDDTSTPKDTQGGEGGGESRAAGTEGAPQAEAPTSPAVDAIATPAAAEGGEASPGGDDAPQDGGARRVSLATESSVASDASVASVRATVASMAADVKAGRMTKEELFKALAGMKAAAAATGGRDGGAAPRAPRAPGGGAPPLPAAADSSDARDGDAPQLASKPSWYHNSREWEAMPFIERSQSWYVQRERDRAEREAKEASEMFSPSLTKLPTWYESAREWEKLPFATRSRLWQERCDRERSRRELLEADALVTRDGATFRPAVDSMSRSIVAAKRVGGGTGFAQPDSPAGGDGGSSTRRGAMSTPERLYRDAKLRQERREEAAKRKESQDDAKFSHTPTLSSSRAYKEVQGVLQINKDPQGMMKRVKSHSQRRASPRPKDPNCTFSPVLVAKPRGSALKQYLTRPAHERLSDVARPSPSASPASSARSPAQHGARRVRSSPSDASPRSVRSEFGRVGRPATTVDPKFKEFVERVDADAAKRKQKQMELQQRLAEATPFKPDTSATRRSEVAQQAKSKILKVAREKTRSLFDNFYKEEHMKPEDAKECKFQPDLSASTRSSKYSLGSRAAEGGRGWTALSTGDARKRAATTLQAYHRSEAEAANAASFTPKLNTGKKMWSHVQGKLRVREDPEGYMERVQQQASTVSKRARAAQQEAEMREFAECTFQPEVHDSPAFVKRIAASVRMTKGDRSSRSTPERPSWK